MIPELAARHLLRCSLMPSKQSVFEAPKAGGRPTRDLPGRNTAGIHDISRAEAEGMAPPEVRQPPSATAERHNARESELSARSMAFDLTAEAAELPSSDDALQSARTLAKLDTLRLTLMKLDTGKAIEAHRSSHQLSLHTLTGHVVLHIDGIPLELPAGKVVVLDRDVVHDITAREDSALLVTVAASGD